MVVYLVMCEFNVLVSWVGASRVLLLQWQKQKQMVSNILDVF